MQYLLLLQEFKKLAKAMVDGEPVEEGPPPPNQLGKQWSLVPPVVADGVPYGDAPCPCCCLNVPLQAVVPGAPCGD